MGWGAGEARMSDGGNAAAMDDLVGCAGDAHLVTFVPNRAGGAACYASDLASYPGQVVVVDVGGAAYAATADRRRAMGHEVVRLDPFGVAGEGTDALEPFDLLDGLEHPALETACQDLAALVIPHDVFTDPYDENAFSLLGAVIAYLTAVPERRTLGDVYATFHTDDVVYNLAVVLDTIGKKIPRMAYTEIAGFLQFEDAVRARILLGVTARLKWLGVPQILAALGPSTVPLERLRAGAPATVYLVVPAERLADHGALLRVWVGTLLLSALRARAEGDEQTGPAPLFVLDRCSALGPFPLLEALLGTRPGAGPRVWTFWHDVHQLRTTFPATWPEIVAGAGAVQVFGTKDGAAAAEAEALVGVPAGEVGSLGATEQVVRVSGDACRRRGPGSAA
ncbi:type IV secretory system conjugative DNA transfer family protein [Streptomyces sp. NPDC058867]|uniref:type IV secretory system conjugative DNA transfer family protein n=1 Tax=unclassified Streptomyces TaxID=2593676 RepID=UPI0036A31E28